MSEFLTAAVAAGFAEKQAEFMEEWLCSSGELEELDDRVTEVEDLLEQAGVDE